jgi:hypothetical protein
VFQHKSKIQLYAPESIKDVREREREDSNYSHRTRGEKGKRQKQRGGT